MVHDSKRPTRGEIGGWKGRAEIVRNVNPDWIKGLDIAQEHIVITILDIPKVAALDRINVLCVADTRASKTEGSRIKDGRLPEDRERHVIRRL